MEWTAEMDDFLRNNYLTMSYTKMGERLGIPARFRTRVNRRCEFLGLRRKSGTEFNKSIFREWSPKMAYLLGIMMSDGSVNYDKNHHDIVIRAAEKDREHLEKIREMFESEKTLRYVPRTKSYVLGLSDKGCCEDLIALGIIPNKSASGTTVMVPRNLLRYFLQGMTDGDGCVIISKGKYLRWTLMVHKANTRLMSQIKREAEDTTGIILNERRDRNLILLELNGQKAIKFLDWMYSDPEYVLRRKYDVYKKGINLCKNY